MNLSTLRLGLAPIAAVWVLGCARETTATHALTCSDPVMTVGPSVAEVAVGDTLPLAAALIAAGDPCNPTAPAADLRWTSSDPSIARVDSVRGVVTALMRGEVQVSVHAPGDTRVLGAAPVHAYTPLFGRIIYTRIIHSSYAPYPCPSGVGSCPPSLWTMAPDGSDQALLADSLNYPESPRVSPDGGTVVFEDWGQLYTVDAAGLDKTHITTTLANNYVPSWSPDGRWILFTGYDNPGDVSQLYLIHRDGTGLRQLTSGPLGAWGSAWSPDGTRIVFMQEVRDTLGQLANWQAVVMDSGGDNPRVIKTFGCCYTVGFPAWSPDGGAILFLGPVTPGSGTWGVGRLRLSDSSFATLADAQGNRPGEWSPDGQLIVYGAGDLWVMNADGTGQHDVLSDAFINMEAAWGPAAPAHAAAPSHAARR